MPLLRNCCCCISLRNGGIILGVLSLIGALIGVIGYSMALAATFHPQLKANLTAEIKRNNEHLEKDEEPMDPSTVFLGVQVWLGWCAALAVFTVICAILLIYGAQNHRRKFLIPSLLAEGIVCVSLLLSCVYQIYVAINPPEHPKTEAELPVGAASSAFGYFIGFAIQFYLWLCVYSLFQWIKEQQLRPQFPQQPYAQQQPYNPGVVSYSAVAKI